MCFCNIHNIIEKYKLYTSFIVSKRVVDHDGSGTWNFKFNKKIKISILSIIDNHK